jgi:hypothetical protein
LCRITVFSQPKKKYYHNYNIGCENDIWKHKVKVQKTSVFKPTVSRKKIIRLEIFYLGREA